MGFFDFIFGKNTLEDGAKLQDALRIETSGDDVSSRLNAAARLMTSRKFDEAIAAYDKIGVDFPDEAGTALGQIGAAYFFKGNFERAIAAYVTARDHGADAGMMDDNIWEACEALAKKEPAQKAAHFARYLELCPAGRYVKQASR